MIQTYGPRYPTWRFVLIALVVAMPILGFLLARLALVRQLTAADLIWAGASLAFVFLGAASTGISRIFASETYPKTLVASLPLGYPAFVIGGTAIQLSVESALVDWLTIALAAGCVAVHMVVTRRLMGRTWPERRPSRS